MVSAAVIQHHQVHLGEGLWLPLPHHSSALREAKAVTPSRNLEAGTEAETMEAGTEAETMEAGTEAETMEACCLLACSWLT